MLDIDWSENGACWSHRRLVYSVPPCPCRNTIWISSGEVGGMDSGWRTVWNQMPTSDKLLRSGIRRGRHQESDSPNERSVSISSRGRALCQLSMTTNLHLGVGPQYRNLYPLWAPGPKGPNEVAGHRAILHSILQYISVYLATSKHISL